jgi:putative DNA primase/helicase
MKSVTPKPPAKTLITSILDGAYECERDHPYLAANGIEGAPCLTYSGDLKISGVEIHGCAFAKIFNSEGVIVNMLFKVKVDEATYEDMLLPGHPLEGTFIHIGKGGKTTLVAEDFASGLALHLATGMRVAVALSRPNLLHVCKALLKKHPDSKLIICGGDHGNMHGHRSIDEVNDVALAVGALVAFPTGEDTFLDFFRKHGAEAVVDLIYEAGLPEAQIFLDPTNGKSGIPVEPSDWSSRVNGEALSVDFVELIKRYLSLPEGAAVAIALWVIHTFLIGEARIAPILGIFSPVPECGKTTVLGLLLRLVFMPVSTSNLTPAVLYRVVNQLSPTLLIDEADTFLQSRELNGVINCGHTRDTAYVQRMESGTVKRYRTFSPKAIGMIGLPSDTVLSRAIAIHLRRKLNTDIKLQLPLGDDVEIAAVRARVARWARDNQEAVAGAQLVLPKFGSGRAADNWEPLLAIAHTLGPICYESAKQAATVLTRKHAKVSCTSEDLLRDIKAAFEKAKTERFPTALLINQLCADDEAPWGTFSKGRSITPTELARLLRAFDISSENMRLTGGAVVKGYKLAQFEDAFSRYVPANRQ